MPNSETSPLNAALRHFEATEANLVKAEKLWVETESSIPTGISFGSDPDYEINCKDLSELIGALPAIDGWKPDVTLFDLDEIAQFRLDATEIGEIEAQISVEKEISEPGRKLREYRYRFNQKRRELIRGSLSEHIDSIDNHLRVISRQLLDTTEALLSHPPSMREVKDHLDQIDTLLGSSVSRPARWQDMARHIYFGALGDVHDIIEHDWPSIKAGLRKSLYGEKEAIPVGIPDLGDLVKNQPRGPVATKLSWNRLNDEDFERLVFTLISSERGYENPEWLMRTNAADRGRDLSVHRVFQDSLGGTLRHRAIIQCKHWQSKSIAVAEISLLKEQMKLWEPPRVDVHIIATSGRFTADAVAWIERHNSSDSALRIEMWAESHLERLLASRPAIIAEFGLR